MTLKSDSSKCLLFILSANGGKDQNMASLFSHNEKPNMEKALFDWPIMLQYLNLNLNIVMSAKSFGTSRQL